MKKGSSSHSECFVQLFFLILILGKNICQYMQGSALHKHRTFHIAISPCMNTLDQGEILLTLAEEFNHVHLFDELFHFSANILFGLSLV
jgi:hypothetical protein